MEIYNEAPPLPIAVDLNFLKNKKLIKKTK